MCKMNKYNNLKVEFKNQRMMMKMIEEQRNINQ